MRGKAQLEQIEGYRLAEVLHRSERTTVLRGRRLADDRAVVVKVLDAARRTPREIARLRYEFELLRELELPGVPTAVGLLEHGGRVALVVEDIGGRDLARISDKRALAIPEVLRIALAAAEVFGQLHQQHVLHGDVKPSNMVLDEEGGRLQLIDFDHASRLERRMALVRQTATLEGTYAFIAPEQTGRTSRPIDHRSDLYSLGASLYRLLTGRLPFEERDPLALVHSHIAVEPRPPHSVNPSIPEPLSDIVLKLMAKAPEHRYQSAYGLAADLERSRAAVAAGTRIERFELGERDVPARFEITPRLYGRERELETLLRTFARVSDRSPEMLLISGYAGVGKSALVHALHGPIAERRGIFVAGKFEQLQSAPYHALVRGVEPLIRDILGAPADEMERYRASLQSCLGTLGQAVIDLVPELELVIGEQPAVPELAPTEAGQRLQLALTSLLRGLAGERPMVLFLDDLQWADTASLRLLETLLVNPELGRLLVIGSYRDNETSDAHPLLLTVASLRDAGIPVSRLSLEPLDRTAVGRFVADTLSTTPEEAAPLVDEVHGKTQGNPFFVGELLRAIYADGALDFDAGAGCWRWDLTRIRALGISQNVADLLSSKLDELPEETRRLVQLGACLGSQFDLWTLGKVSELGQAELAGALWPALREEVLLPVGEGWRLAGLLGRPSKPREEIAGDADGGSEQDARLIAYRFPHDRVQEAAYALLPETGRERSHLRIGRLLLAAIPEAELEEHPFEVVRQLNRGSGLIETAEELGQLCRLNLRAARAAQAAAAFRQAFEYSQHALALFPRGRFERDRRGLGLEVHRIAAEAAHLVSEVDAMNHCIESAGELIESARDRAAFVQIEVLSHLDRREADQAVTKAVDCLAGLGIRLPRRPRTHHVVASLLRTRWMLRRRSLDELYALPEATDPDSLAAQSLIQEVLAAAYISAPDLYPLLTLELVRQSLRHGNTAYSAGGYAGYAIMLVAAFDARVRANHYGDLALRLVERPEFRQYRPRVVVVVDDFLRHWQEPLRGLIPPVQEAYREAREVGDLEFVGIGAVVHTFLSVMAGVPLPEIEEQAARFSAAIRDQKTPLHMHDCWRQWVLNLMGLAAADPCQLTGESSFDETVLLPELDRTSLCGFHILKMTLASFLERDELAAEHLTQAEPLLDSLVCAPHIPWFHFHAALVRLRTLPESGRPRRKGLAAVRASLRKLRRWQKLAPTNHRYRADLIEAEMQRVAGRGNLAADLYDAAIAGARAGGVLSDEALANELAGRFHLALGRQTVGRAYLAAAYDGYAQWGAQAKLAVLRERYPWLGGSVGTGSAESTSSSSSELDLESVLRASQAISTEIRLDDLVRTLMTTAVQNAGAQSGALLLRQADGLRIVAQKRDVESDPEIFEGLPVEEEQGYAASVIRYVDRSGERVVLGDAAQTSRFRDDPHLAGGRVASILCMPIEHQHKRLGVLYLENRLTPDAFSADRIRALSALSGQMAVSLENARLYGSLEESLAFQVEVTRAQGRLVPDQFLHALGRKNIKEIELGDHAFKELSILFSDMRGFTPLIESFTPAEAIAFINSYLGYMEGPITQQGGFIDSYLGDAIMALFETDADHAVRAGLDMLDGLARFNEDRRRDGLEPVRIGIGINTGPLVLGTIGSPNRFKCGVIGDPVNLASRVESLTKQYDVPMLISNDTFERLADPSRYCIRMVERVRVAGRDTPVTLYEVFDADAPELREAKLASQERFLEATELFYAGKPGEALPAFLECAVRLPRDRTLQFYMDRCRQFIDHPAASREDMERKLEK